MRGGACSLRTAVYFTPPPQRASRLPHRARTLRAGYRVLVAETKEGKWVADLRTASRGAAKQARAAAKEARDAAKEMHEESKSKKHEKGDNGHHGDKAHANNGHHGETPMNNAAAVVAA